MMILHSQEYCVPVKMFLESDGWGREPQGRASLPPSASPSCTPACQPAMSSFYQTPQIPGFEDKVLLWLGKSREQYRNYEKFSYLWSLHYNVPRNYIGMAVVDFGSVSSPNLGRIGQACRSAIRNDRALLSVTSPASRTTELLLAPAKNNPANLVGYIT